MHLGCLTEILGIDNHKVKSIIYNNEYAIGLYLEMIDDTVPAICSCCGRSHDKVHDTETVTVEDLSMSGKRVFLIFKKRKLKCDELDAVRVEEFKWLRGRFTERYAEQVYRLTSITSNQEAGWFLYLDDETVYRTDKAILEEKALEKLNPIPEATNLSVDEVAFQKWHKYVTNVIDVDRRKVIWNANGRGKETLSKFYKKQDKETCENIETVAMDGASGYISATREHATNAILVYDKFHINKKLNTAIDDVRKNELRMARKTDNEELKDLVCCGQRWLLLKNKNLTNNQQTNLSKLLSINEPIAKAKILKDDFLSIYQLHTPEEAKTKLENWLKEAENSSLEPFKELAESFGRKADMIINYFKKKISSAISEGINNKIKRLKRMAYGYRDVDYFLLKIHQHCGLLSPRHST
jgi:transposase